MPGPAVTASDATVGQAKAVECEALIIGAGPAGLFQAFELGLQEIAAHIVDALPHAGGQCVELYGDKPIYDIPAIPVCSGQELTQRLLEQLRPMSVPMHLGWEVMSLRRTDDGRFDVATRHAGDGTARKHVTHAVFIAGGAGCFQPRTLKLPGVDALEGREVIYRVEPAQTFVGQHLLVMGDDDAVEWALRCAEAPAHQRPASVTLMHRRDVFRAAPSSVQRLRARVAEGRMQLVIGQAVGLDIHLDTHLDTLTLAGPEGVARQRLRGVQVVDSQGRQHTLRADAVLARLGLSPKLGTLAQIGLDLNLALERKHLVVNPATCQTAVPGLYCVGDLAAYPGKRKLILSAFHEATMAAFAAAEWLHPERPNLLEYTTTSTRLHRVLGV